MTIKKIILGIAAISGLVLTILPSILVYNDIIAIDQHKQLMVLGMVIWFVAAPFVMNQKIGEAEA